MTPREQYTACRKPAEFERWAMQHAIPLLDENDVLHDLFDELTWLLGDHGYSDAEALQRVRQVFDATSEVLNAD